MTTNNPRLSSKRQILFQKDKTVEIPPEEKPTIKKPKYKPLENANKDVNPQFGGTIEERTTSLYKWLKTHHLVNLNKLCEICGIDRGNFVRGIAADKPIKQEILEKFEKTLKQYGYAE